VKDLFDTSGRAPASVPEVKRVRYVKIAVVLTLAAIMAFLALRASPYLQYVSWMPRRVGVWADHNGVLRNTVAFFGFSLVVLGLLGVRAWHVAGLCVFGTVIEVAQIWIPSRRFDWKDIVATIVGILLAWPVAWGVRRLASVR
jgi:hypothetical protein